MIQDPTPPIRLPGSSLPEQSGPRALAFSGEDGDFLRLVARGAALQLLTFGFYRFWLVTDVRRHLWSHTSLDGDAFEYAGLGRELVFGFLFALAILTPVYLLYFVVGLEVERLKAFASVPLFLFFFVFQQFAIYRARRYRLTRTIWRGLRFWMSGSGWSYALRSSLWLLAVVLTLGLAHPWRVAALERYKLRHTFYGDLQGRFVATGGALFARIWWIWLALAIPLAMLIAAGVVQARHGSILVDAPVANALAGGALIAALILPLLWPLFRAIEWRWWVEGLRLGDVRAASVLSSGALFGLYAKFAVIGALVVGVIGFVGLVLGAAAIAWSGLTFDELLQTRGDAFTIALTIAMFLAYFCAGLAVGALQRYFLQRGLWRAVATTSFVFHVDALAAVASRGAAAHALGEGLADGLDVAGF